MNAISPPPPRDERPSLPTLEFVSPTEAEIRRPANLVARGMILVVGCLVAALLTLMALMPVDRVVSASGSLIGKVPNILIQPLEPAIVRSFEVRTNQVIRRGDLIARLDPTFTGADLTALSTQEAALTAEVARLEAEASENAFTPGPGPAMALQAAIFAQREAERQFRIEALRQRMRSLEEGIQRSQAELAQLQQRAQIAGQIEVMRRDLERVQVGSRLNSLLASDTRIEVQRAIATTEGQLRGGRRDLAAASADLDAYVGNWRAQVAQDLVLKRRELSDVREAASKARLRQDLVEMRAPADAVVLEIGKSSAGAVLAAGEMLATLVPLDAALEVEALLEPRDIGFVGIGDRVTLKFATFPFIRHGTAVGRVLSISQDSTQVANVPNAPKAYRARISLDDFRLRNLPSDFRLLPGMPVQADIIVGHRTPLSYFFERALPNLVQGLREP